MCKSHKHAGHGDAKRQTFQVLKSLGLKNPSRWNRHDAPLRNEDA